MAATVNRFFQWSLAFTHPHWALTPKSQIPIELHFDGGPPFSVVGTVLRPILVEVPMPNNSKLINTFRSSSQMSAQAQGQWFLFNLNGTSRIMVLLANCVSTELALEGGKPLSSPPVTAQPSVAQNPSQETLLEETQLATNFLLAARLPGAQLLGRGDVPVQLASYGAVWKAQGAIGAVKIYPPQPQLTGLDLASQMIASDAQGCKGKFASARYSELVDNDVVVRAVTSCSDSEHETEVQYFIAPRATGGFVGFSILAATASGKQDMSSEQKVDVFKKAALTAVSKH